MLVAHLNQNAVLCRLTLVFSFEILFCSGGSTSSCSFILLFVGRKITLQVNSSGEQPAPL